MFDLFLNFIAISFSFLFIFKYGFDFEYLDQGGGLQVYKMTIFPTADLGTAFVK